MRASGRRLDCGAPPLPRQGVIDLFHLDRDTCLLPLKLGKHLVKIRLGKGGEVSGDR